MKETHSYTILHTDLPAKPPLPRLAFVPGDGPSGPAGLPCEACGIRPFLPFAWALFFMVLMRSSRRSSPRYQLWKRRTRGERFYDSETTTMKDFILAL
jgi:hypothetical protein